MAEGSHITLEDLELNPSEAEPLPFNLKEVREEAERKAIQRALAHTDKNVSDTAKLLGITRPTLYTMLDKYDLKP
jgi:two-component system NtrC family response regulator